MHKAPQQRFPRKKGLVNKSPLPTAAPSIWLQYCLTNLDFPKIKSKQPVLLLFGVDSSIEM